MHSANFKLGILETPLIKSLYNERFSGNSKKSLDDVLYENNQGILFEDGSNIDYEG